jgi:hypothetical protein
MEWPGVLKKEIHALREQILSLAQEFIPQGKKDEQSIESLVSDIGNFCLWADTLPDDMETWEWIGGDVVKSSFSGESWLDRVVHLKFQLFLLFNGNRTDVSTQSTVLHKQIEASLERVDRLLNEHLASKPCASRDMNDQLLHPHMLLTALWPYVYPAMVDQSFSDFSVRDWPLVRYHPYWTHHLIFGCISRLSEKQFALKNLFPVRAPKTVYVRPHWTPQFFELRLSIPERLMPVRWETLMDSLSWQWTNDVEALRELGGDITPLTWDEGHGEGVIVRLPWATE